VRPVPTWTSTLSVDEFSCLREAGFEPVGQVMGGVVHRRGWWHQGSVDCGYGAERRVVPYTHTVWQRRRLTFKQMAEECAALGGDGVVAVRVAVEPFEEVTEQLTKFQTFGTAVRAIGPVRPPRPFVSDLSGQDFAKLIEAGWVPINIALGAVVSIRHDYHYPASGIRTFGPREMVGWTDLLSDARSQARARLDRDLRRVGADGVVVSSIDLDVTERECERHGDRETDHFAEASIRGTAIARFRESARTPRPLKIMPLT
jgi:uncharacterized protein YbjQ (UPF0145 family)